MRGGRGGCGGILHPMLQLPLCHSRSACPAALEAAMESATLDYLLLHLLHGTAASGWTRGGASSLLGALLACPGNSPLLASRRVHAIRSKRKPCYIRIAIMPR